MTEKEKILYHKKRYAEYRAQHPLIENAEDEIWRATSVSEIYHISNLGRVKSWTNGRAKLMSPQVNHNGYLWVTLRQNGKLKKCFIHRLVAGAFIPNPDNKPAINHIDGVKFNNHADNLEWVTPGENARHAARMGLLANSENHYRAKLKNTQAFFASSMAELSVNVAQLADSLNVPRDVIKNLVNDKTYQHGQKDALIKILAAIENRISNPPEKRFEEFLREILVQLEEIKSLLRGNNPKVDPITKEADLVILQNRQALTTSLLIAETFEKRHDHVIRDIEEVVRKLTAITAPDKETPNLGFLNIDKMFIKGAYEVEGQIRKYPMYYLNRDGFTLLAMGFDGEEALRWKLKYIDAFNRMETILKKF